jgi:hypothetical protein
MQNNKYTMNRNKDKPTVNPQKNNKNQHTSRPKSLPKPIQP